MGRSENFFSVKKYSNIGIKIDLFLIVLLAGSLICGSVSAGTFGVDFFDSPTPVGQDLSAGTITISPGDSLQDATDMAGSNGTVILNPGVYEVAGVECSENIRFMSNSSAGGNRSNTVIVSVAENKSIISGFWVGEIVVEGLTLTNTSGRGAIADHGGRVVLISSALTHCNSERACGGGIYAGSAFVADSIISYCYSSDGGGIYTSYGDTTIINSTIESCSGSCGGAVYVIHPFASLQLINSTISRCYAEFYGGGVCCNYNGSSITAVNTTFTNCIAGHNGGAVCGGDRSIVTVSGCTIVDCSTSDNSGINNKYGGAVYGGEESVITIVNCRIRGCYADDDGGAVCGWKGSQIRMTGSSFEDCYAAGKGGFLRISSNSSADVYSSRIYNCDSSDKTMVYAGVSSSVDAENNWWGSNENPSGYLSGDVDADPWLIFTSEVTPYMINRSGHSSVRAGVYSNSEGTNLSNSVCIPDGTIISFSCSRFGRIFSSQSTGTISGVSEGVFSPWSLGYYGIYSSLDDQTINSEIIVTGDGLSELGALGFVIFVLVFILIFTVIYSGKRR